MPKVIVIILLLVLVVSPLSVLGQTPSTQQGEEKVVTGTTEVIFDAVVKDKKGRPVKDLKVQDFQIRGRRAARGEVVSAGSRWRTWLGCDRQTGQGRRGPKATARVLEAFNAGRIGTVALVFDRLSADSRTRAHDAALAYLGSGLGQSDFVGVVVSKSGPAIEQIRWQGVNLFLTAYAPGDASATKLSLEIAQRGQTIGQLSYDRSPADQNGRIQYASAIPLDKFQPGNYELKVTAQNAKTSAMNTAFFTIIP